MQFQPNPHMTAYAFYYRVAAQYLVNNNAYIFPVIDRLTGTITAFYPIDALTVGLLEHQGEMYYSFSFAAGQKYIAHHSNVIHLRRHYNDNDIFGSANAPIAPVLQTADTFNQSMIEHAKLVSVVRGVLEVGSLVKDESINAARDKFVTENLSADKNGAGVVVTSDKMKYTPIDQKTTPVPAGQLGYVQQEFYDYFGVNEKIIQSKASPEEWTAFYEGMIEPFFIQLAQALTNCCFTERERGHGNEISLESNRLQFANVNGKTHVAKFLADVGAASVDEIREIFNMAPLGGEDGARRTQTLNVVNAIKADKYQLGETETIEENEEKDAG